MVKITDNEMKIVQAILKKYLPDSEVWVFGSRVKGQVKPFSDLDLVIKSNEPLPIGKIAFLKEAFSESDLPFRVDLVEWASISDEFRQVILNSYENLPLKNAFSVF